MIDRLKALKALHNKEHFDPISFTWQMSAKFPGPLGRESVRHRMLDVLLNIGIPFNRWLGLRIKEFGQERVVIESPPTTLRKNHVGTAHACAQALIGEYAAGLLVAQRFPIESYRMIIGKLEIEYKKAGRGTLLGIAEAPGDWPALDNDEAWVPMETRISDEGGNLVAICKTNWQVKSWQRIERDKRERAAQAE